MVGCDGGEFCLQHFPKPRAWLIRWDAEMRRWVPRIIANVSTQSTDFDRIDPWISEDLKSQQGCFEAVGTQGRQGRAWFVPIE